MTDEIYHEAILLKEVMRTLAPEPGKAYLDCTLGTAGHSLGILSQLGGRGLLVGIDINIHAIQLARRRIEQAGIDPALVRLIEGNFGDLTPLLQHAQFPPFGGILLDLGISSPQLLSPELGLSWENDTALDMRLSKAIGDLSAEQIVNEWNEEDLARLFRENAQERWSRRIARRIVEHRDLHPIRTGRQLGEVVAGAIPRKAWPPKIHPATRVFLAIRMAVNREMENLEAVLPQAVNWLETGGRLAVISFNSEEDRRVKRFMRSKAHPPEKAPWPLPQTGPEEKPALRILTRRPVRPSAEEIRSNPRSRSARLRVAEKL